MRIEYIYNRYRKVKLSVPYGAREIGQKKRTEVKREKNKSKKEKMEIQGKRVIVIELFLIV